MAASTIETTLDPLIELVHDCDPSGLSTDELRVASAAARRLERSVESLLVRIGRRSNELSAATAGPEGREVLLGTGEVSARRARTDAARAEVAAALPALEAALQSGSVGGEHLDVVAVGSRGLCDEQRAALAEQESLVAEAATRLPVDPFRTWFRQRIDAVREDHGRQRHLDQRTRSEFRHWKGADGMGHLSARLDPIRFDALVGAVDAEMRSLTRQTNTSAEVGDGHTNPIAMDANLAAEALVGLVMSTSAGRGRAEIKVVVDATTALVGPHPETLSETSAGSPVPIETLERLACAADIQRVVVDPRTMEVAVGRRHRTATPAQWAALTSLYATCAWFGCDRPIDWCQAHHLHTWEDGGLTDLDNLVPLCSRHHHLAHEGQWSLELLADRTLRLTTPDGVPWRSATPDRLESWLAWRRSIGDPPGSDPGVMAT